MHFSKICFCLWFTFLLQRFAFPTYSRELHNLGTDLKTPIHSMLISVYSQYIFNVCNMFRLLHCINMHWKSYNSTICCQPEKHRLPSESQDFFLVMSRGLSSQVLPLIYTVIIYTVKSLIQIQLEIIKWTKTDEQNYTHWLLKLF